jgi:hypothetical protein
MTTNMGTIDRVLRIVIGLVRMAAYVIPLRFAPSGWNWIGWIGVISLATAIFEHCPTHPPFGVLTCLSNNT